MPTVAVNLSRNIGESGLMLLLFDGADAIGSYPLSEVPGTLGRFEADLTAELETASTYRAVVSRDDTPIYEGWYRPSVSDVVDQPPAIVQAKVVDIVESLQSKEIPAL